VGRMCLMHKLKLRRKDVLNHEDLVSSFTIFLCLMFFAYSCEWI